MKTWVVSCLAPLFALGVSCGDATEEGPDTGEVTGNDDDAANDEDEGTVDEEDDDAPNGVNDDDMGEEEENDDTPNGVNDDDAAENDTNASRAIPGVVLMDDGENGDNALLTGGDAEFLGYWYTFDDRQECDHPDFAEGNAVVCGSQVCAASGLTTPLPDPQGGTGFTMTAYDAADAPAPPLEGEQTENLYGVRVQGGGNKSWGAGIGVGLNNPSSPSAYGLTEHGFVAIRFLARVVEPGATVSVNITDAYSEPFGARCLERQSYCSDVASLSCTCAGAMSQGCFDHPQVVLGGDPAYPALTDEWQLYEIRLDDLRRGTSGAHEVGSEPPSPALDATQAYQLQFEVMRPITEETLPPFDLWIDNVGFVAE